MPDAAQRYVAVIGPGDGVTEQDRADACAVGELLARDGHVVVTGGLGGVMEAASEGAHRAGGITLGLLPGDDRATGNPFLTIAVATGLGELRNGLVVRCADAVIAIGGSWGTLSEVSLAVRTDVPTVSLNGWSLPAEGVIVASGPSDAVSRAVAAIALRSTSP